MTKKFILIHKNKIYESILLEGAASKKNAVYTFGYVPNISDDILDFWFESGIPHTEAKIKDGSCFVNLRDYNIKGE